MGMKVSEDHKGCSSSFCSGWTTSSQNSHLEQHSPGRRLEGLPAASLPLESLQKSCKSDASAAEELRVGSLMASS